MRQKEHLAVKTPQRAATIFAVETDGRGKRFVHYFGYLYETDDGPRLLEYSFFILPLEQVIQNGFFECESRYGCDYKQYITILNDNNEAVAVFMKYANGEAPKLLHSEEQIRMDLKDGFYAI